MTAIADQAHDGELDEAERIVYDRLRYLGCNVAVDPSDPEDCADVAWNAVDALRQAGLLPCVKREQLRSAAASGPRAVPVRTRGLK